VTAVEDSVFAGLRGQAEASRVLLSALVADRVPHAYLFAGPDGVGKRTAALKLAQALECPDSPRPGAPCGVCRACEKSADGTHPDVLMVGFARQAALLKEPVEKQKSLKIDTLREMERSLRMKPMEGRVKVAILDPADALAEAASHALLKILEEPPSGTHLILLSTEPSALLGTIRSRCQRVVFRPLGMEDLVRELQVRRGLDETDARAAALEAEGSLGRALERADRGAGIAFDWEGAPLVELMGWCEQFQNPRLGREGAVDFLRRLLTRARADLRAGRRPARDVERVLTALERVERNVSPSLALQTLLLRLRRDAKRREAAA
jgi:DNA polymerase-3 subunit delta'